MSRLEAGARAVLGRPLTERERGQFGKYLDLLTKWQRTHRLVGSTAPDWVADRLFLDSLLFLKVLPSPVGALLDIGAGAGFPGIPLKIILEDLKLTMIEARRRRASFLATLVRELNLVDVIVVNARAEDVAVEFRGEFDSAVTRCAVNPRDLHAFAETFLRPGGVFVASGSPTPAAPPWVQVRSVPGVLPGTTRQFLVATHPR